MDDDFDILFSTTERGTILAATTASPYFCFEAKDKDELYDLLKRALDFYKRHASASTPVVSRTFSVTDFRATDKVRASELAAA